MVETVVSASKNAVQAVVTVVIKSVKYIFDAVVQFVEQIYDLVETIFDKVKVAFEDLFQWLRFLFDWDDILRSSDAIQHAFRELLRFLEEASLQIKNRLDKGFQAFSDDVRNSFEARLKVLLGKFDTGSYLRENTPSDSQLEYNIDSSLTTNIVFASLLNNSADVRLPAPIGLTLEDNLYRKLEEYANKLGSNEVFEKAKKYFEEIKSVDNVRQFGLSGLVSAIKDLILFALKGAQAVTDAVLKAVALLLQQFLNIMETEWKIPLLSDFYTHITRENKMVPLGLLALALATSYTVLYKLVRNVAPFPTHGDVEEFKKAFTAQKFLTASGLLHADSRVETLIASPSEEYKALLDHLFLCSTILWSISGSAVDVTPPGKPEPEGAGKQNLFWEFVMLLSTVPWFFGAGAPDCEGAEGLEPWSWIVGAVAVAVDTVFVELLQRFDSAENFQFCRKPPSLSASKSRANFSTKSRKRGIFRQN